MLNTAFTKVVNDQYLFKLLLGSFQFFWLHDASADGSIFLKFSYQRDASQLKLNYNY